MNNTVLVVDDDQNWLFTAECLLRDSFRVLKSRDRQSCLESLDQERVQLVILDLAIPGVSEFELLTHIKRFYSSIPVVILTARSDIRTATAAMRSGADDYVTKEDAEELLLYSVTKNIENQNLKTRVAGFQAELQSRARTFVPSHPAYQQVFEMATKYVQHNVCSICIEGETGTGKTMIVEYLRNTLMPDRPMISENCANFTASIADSLLLGHEKGAFTGADKQQKGKFELADGGILFLDEIGNMPLEVQEKVLCAIRDKKIKRVGGVKEIPVDFMLITATNSDLKQAVEQGTFRKDLYYRINQAKLKMPSLAEYPEVVPEFMEHFIKYFNEKLNKNFVPDGTFKNYILNQSWEGNVAELSGVIELVIQFHPDESIINSLVQSSASHSPDCMTLVMGTLKERVMAFEKREIIRALQENRNNVSGAARQLGIPQSTLQSKIQKLGIRPAREDYDN